MARNNLGMALANKPDQAAVNWQSVGDPAAAHNNMAALLIQQGRYAEARKELDLALGYNRTYPAALNNLRLVSELDGKPASIPAKPAADSLGQGEDRACIRPLFTTIQSQPSVNRNQYAPENRRGL